MNNTFKIIIVLSLVALTNIIGHYFPPSSILFSPFTIGLLAGLLMTTNFKVNFRILLLTIFIILNDILIKKFAGGTHDFEGAGFINMFLIIGVTLSTVIISLVISDLKDKSVLRKIILVSLMPIAMFFYLHYFDLYGLSYHKSMSLTKEDAINNNTFLHNLKFSERKIYYEKDSIYILSGWTEKEIILDHSSLIRESQETKNINYKLKIKHNLTPLTNSLYYKINSDDVNGSSPVDSVLEFKADRDESIILSIFKLRNGSVNDDTIVGKIIIKQSYSH